MVMFHDEIPIPLHWLVAVQQEILDARAAPVRAMPTWIWSCREPCQKNDCRNAGPGPQGGWISGDAPAL